MFIALMFLMSQKAVKWPKNPLQSYRALSRVVLGANTGLLVFSPESTTHSSRPAFGDWFTLIVERQRSFAATGCSWPRA